MRKVLKVTLYIIGFLIFLIAGLVVYLNTPWGENFVRERAQAYLRTKLKTYVLIGHLGYGLPKFIELDDVLFKDQANDTLLAVKELRIDINMLQLLHKKVDVQELVLTGVHAHVYRNLPDTTYNFSYMIAAFTGTKPKQPKPKDTSSSAFTIDLARVKFDDIHVRFEDHTGGMNLLVNLDHLDLRMKKLDMDKMVFHVKDLAIAGLETKYSQDTSYLPPPPPDTTKTQFQLVADNADIQRVSFDYNNSVNKIFFGLDLERLQMELNKFSLADNKVDLKKLMLKNANIIVHMGKQATAPAIVDSIVKKDTTEGWNVDAGAMDLVGIHFKMDDDNSPRQKTGMDYSHLDFANTSLSATSFLYTSDTIAGNIKHFSGSEQSGLYVMALSTIFNYNPQGATLQNLYLKTPYTNLQDHIEIHYPSLAALQKRMQSMQLNINLKNSTVGLPDVLLFVPQLKDQEIFRKYKEGHFKIDVNMAGFLNDLNIQHLYLTGLDNTEVLLNGRLSGLPDPKSLSYNLNVSKLQSSRKDLSKVVPDSLLSSVRIPDLFKLNGQISGTELDYNTNMYLESTDGYASVSGILSMSKGKGKEVYNLSVTTNKLNLGHILKQDSLMGRITADMKVKGKSFDVKKMDASLQAKITSAFVKGYRYHNIALKGDMDQEKGNITMSAIDTNLQMHMTGYMDFSGKYAAVKANIQLDSIDFTALRLYSSEFRARGTISLDFPELNPDYPRGTFLWEQPIINANNKRYYLDSMYIVSSPSADTGQNIVASLDVMQARVTGKTPLTKIAGIVMDHINRHYTLPSTDSVNASIAANTDSSAKQSAHHGIIKTKADTTAIPTDYDLKLTAHVVDKPMLHGLLPGLTSFDSIHIDGSLAPQSLIFNVNIPDLVYGSTTITNGIVAVRGTDSAFTYKVTVDQINEGKFQLWYADIHGNMGQNEITSNISLADQSKKERFALSGNLQKNGALQVVHINKGLKLNYVTWDVAEPNSITLANDGFYIQGFDISNSGQFIKAASDELKANSPIKIDINNFHLGNITDAVSSNDTLIAGGVLGGNVTIQRMNPAMQMTADLHIDSMTVLGDTVGNLQVSVDNKQDNQLSTKLTLKGNGNDLALDGTYYLQTTNGNDFDFNLALNALALHAFEHTAMNQIRKSSGFIRGNLKIQGTASAPQLNGELKTDNLKTTISQVNAAFNMPAEKLDFNNSDLTFNNFTIHDSADNKAVISGDINMADLSAMQMNMGIDAKNWRALHSTPKDNDMFYGDLLLTTNLTIKGTPSAPQVDGDLHILKGTNVTVVTPESNPQVESSVGIVKFVNMKDTGRLNVLVPKKTADTVKKRKLSPGSEFNINLTTDKEAAFSLIIDKESGDYISVKGDATINASVTPGGEMSLSGSYELHEGAYQMNYNFIKRKFLIKDGSTITFGGDAIKGTQLDLTAVYEAKIPPYDLIENEVSDPSQLNYFKQNLPFDVNLSLKGQVLHPEITFDVVLPENQVYPISADQVELIQGKLAQIRTDTSELNKQVFAILILGRFVSDDPFTNGAGNGVGFTALQSVSTFIGEQLNQEAGKLVKGVDISADLATTEDYTTGDMRERTDLNLAASKRLLNDRLKLTIGNDFELEGPQTQNNSQSQLIPSNLAADYLLAPDGRYTVRAYRKNYDEGVLEGYVTETGLDFIVSVDFNHFRSIFKKKKKEESNGTGKK
jgi:autotransporter translocation and assembly factor TamB